jgi:hypothetical protein
MRKLYWLLPSLFTFGVACSGSSGAAAQRPWTPTMALVSEVEASLELPEGAFPLNTYVRHFAGVAIEERRVVVGTFLQDPDGAGVRIVDLKKMPKVLDGGCDVINLKYDIERKKVLELFCNGEA